MGSEPGTSLRDAVWGWGLAGGLAGLVLGLVDVAALYGHWSTPLFGVGDVLVLGVMVLALVSLVGALAGVLLAPCGHWAERRLAALLRTGPRRLVAALVPASAAAAGVVVNATFYVGLYAHYHALLALAALLCATLALRLVRPLELLAGVRGGAVALGALLLWSQGVGVLPDLAGQGVRILFHTRALHAAPFARALTALTDFDRDGISGVLAAGDCDSFDGEVHPGARDIPGDGIDQDCLAGDASMDAARTLATRRAAAAAPPVGFPVALRPIIIVSVDALRSDYADQLEAFGRFRNRGTEFPRAYVPYPSTILSFYSLLTGRAPGAIETRREAKWDVPIPDRSETLPERLARHGYRSEALFFHHIFAPHLGITRGFDAVWTESGDPKVVVWGRSADQTADRAIAALERLDRDGHPYLLWAHFYDPHEPYIEHPEFPVGDSRSYRGLYEGELRFTDRHLLRLFDELEGRGLFERALVVFTADHGESLGEGGVLFHASNLREEQLRVPLVLAGPGIAAAAQVETPVSLQDLSDTLCALVGVQGPARSQGASFAGLLGAGEASPSPLFAEVFPDSGPQRAVILWPWKLIHHPRVHAFELFHLEKDPGERFNVFDLVPAEAERLQSLLAAWSTLVELPR